MTVKTLKTPDEVSVVVEGDLDLSSVAAFQASVNDALETRQSRRLVIDLRDTYYIDSAGLEQLLVANRKLVTQGDRLLVRIRPSSQPQTVLTITGFSAVMDVEPSAGT